jgi:twitching motility protein PilT
MQTFDQSIFGLYSQGLIALDEAMRWASNVDEFKLRVQGISTTADLSRDEMASTVFGKPGGKTSTGKPGAPEITRFGK